MALQYCFANGEVRLRSCHLGPGEAGAGIQLPLEVSGSVMGGRVQRPACTGSTR